MYSHDNSDIGGIFSFFPCKNFEDESNCGFARPALDPETFCLKKNFGRKFAINVMFGNSRKSIIKHFEDKVGSGENSTKQYWDLVVDEVFTQELSLGIYAEEPCASDSTC